MKLQFKIWLIAFFIVSTTKNYAQENHAIPKLVLPIGHTSFINQLVFSPDGTKIASAGADHTAKIWDVASGKLLIDFNGFGSHNRVFSVAFSPDGTLLATASGADILLWDASTGIIRDTIINKSKKEISHLDFSADGKSIYAICLNEVNAWDLDSKKIIIKGIDFLETNSQLEFSPFRNLFAIASNSTIEVYDSTGNNVASLENISKPQNVQFGYKDSLVTFLTASGELYHYHLDLSTSDTVSNIDSTYQIKALPDSLNKFITSYTYSPDRKTIVLIRTTGAHQYALILNTKDLTELARIEFPFGNAFKDLVISNNSKYYAFLRRNDSDDQNHRIDSTLLIWNRDTKSVSIIKQPEHLGFQELIFSPDNKKFISTYELSKPLLWDIEKQSVSTHLEMFGKETALIKSMYSADGNKIIQIKDGGIVEFWEANTLKKITEVTGSNIINNNNALQNYPVFNFDASKMFEIYQDDISNKWGIRIWSIVKSKKSTKFEVLFDPIQSSLPIQFLHINSDSASTRLISTNSFGKINLWNIETKMLVRSISDSVVMNFAKFSPNGKLILGSGNKWVKAWNTADGSLQYRIGLPSDTVYSLNMSQNGVLLGVMKLRDTSIQIFDMNTGKFLKSIQSKSKFYSLSFSQDGTKAVTYSMPDIEKAKTRFYTDVWDLKLPGELITNSLNYFQSYGLGSYFKTNSLDFDDSHFTANALIKNPLFSPDGKKILTVYANDPNELMLWSVDGNDSLKLKGHTRPIVSANFSKDGKYIFTGSLDNTSKIWKLDGTPLFTFIGLPGAEFLVLDSLMRFDGSNEAKKSLYVTCGNEIIDLEQFEDMCWEPDLVAKTLGTVKGQIKAQSLSAIKLCSMIPLVVNENDTKEAYNFTIFEHQGGIGKLELYVNNKRIKNLLKSDLTKIKELQYQLKVEKNFVQPYFMKGIQNVVYLRAYTSDNKILSRGGTDDDDEVDHSRMHKSTENVKPDVYLVSVGINKYGAAQLNKLIAPPYDAKEFSKAIVSSSSNLFNQKDTVDHVFSYVFTSDSIAPNKENIMKALSNIALKAKADDIFIFFFAGHAIYYNSPDDIDRNQLYLLTSASASFDMKTKTERDAAISSDELLTALQTMKMSNQILVLDACNTGSINKDVRVLEKLNDKQGTFILAGSAPTESSFERTDLMHGYLTYSLLQDIKEGTNLHSDENGKNNIIGAYEWLDESRKLVIKKSKEFNGQVQEPQVFGKNSFDVGKVDTKVRDAIFLPQLKKLIGNISADGDDEKQLKGAQDLRDSLPKLLFDYIGKNNLTNEIGYNSDISSENKNAYVVNVSDYKLVGKSISVQIKITRGSEFITPKKTFTDLLSNKSAFMNGIAKFVIESIKNSKIN
jgi:WD40 repeat protein